MNTRAGDRPRVYVDPSRQGGGRADNPRHYQALYLSESPQGAVGEVFGNLAVWSREMFAVPWLTGVSLALATLHADPPPEVLDLDDPSVLVTLGVKPTEVVGRERERTQEIALSVWLENRWQGLRWWSWWRPVWHHQILWAPWTPPTPGLSRSPTSSPSTCSTLPSVWPRRCSGGGRSEDGCGEEGKWHGAVR